MSVLMYAKHTCNRCSASIVIFWSSTRFVEISLFRRIGAEFAIGRYILFPESFRLVFETHLEANPKNRFLFETSRFGLFTPGRIQQIVQEYRNEAGISQNVRPRIFRHQMITYLTVHERSDPQMVCIKSGFLFGISM